MSADQAKIAELHRNAMLLAHEAAATQDSDLANQLYARAFDEEREAATLLATVFDLEPTRAILHRSAVSLGMRCRRLPESYEVLVNGLASRNPEVKAELRELQGEIDQSLAARMGSVELRRKLERTWDPYGWRARIPEILAAFLGKIDRYLELNGFSTHESKEIALLALARLHASDAQRLDIAQLELALFHLLHDLCVERRPREAPPG